MLNAETPRPPRKKTPRKRKPSNMIETKKSSWRSYLGGLGVLAFILLASFNARAEAPAAGDDFSTLVVMPDTQYSTDAGNHDYFHWDRKTLPVNFIKYFGPQRYAGRSWFGGFSPANATLPAGMNMYQYFSAGGVKFLSIGLQYAPDARDLAWAQK